MAAAPPRRPLGRRSRSAMLLVVTLLATALSVLLPHAEVAQARYATGGTGAYRGSIDWFEWGTAGTPIPAGGLTRTNTRTVAGQSLATTCTISNLSGSLTAYRPGSWRGDGLDDLYNIGGVGGSNQLITGLATAGSGNPTFSVACSVTLNGAGVPLAGLVMADAEQSGQLEYVQATIPAGAQWRLIDRVRTAGCASDTTVTRSGQTLRMTGPATLCDTGPDGIAFMQGATSATVELKGGGVSAIALGVMLFNDFGDAPASYGQAGALYSPAFAGDTVPQGASSLFGARLNTQTQPTTRLGATVDSEGSQQSSAGAGGDGADEDAIGPLGTVPVTPGTTYTLPGVACTGPGAVAGWLDWDGDGTFDPDERSAVAACSGASVSLTWTVPAYVAAGATFVRLRIGPNAASLASPTGVTTAGEVEDHPLTVLPSADFGDGPATAGTTRAADGPYHLVPGYDAGTGTAPLMLGDRIDLEGDGSPSAAAGGDDAAGLDDEDAVGPLDVTVGVGRTIEVSVTNTTGAPATLAGWIDLDGDGTLEAGERAVATVPAGTDGPVRLSFPAGTTTQATFARFRLLPGSVADPAPTGAATAGEVEDHPVAVLVRGLEVTKRSDASADTAPGDVVTYTVTLRNTGTGAYTPADPARLVDDLTHVLDDATYRGDATASAGPVPVYSARRLAWTGPLAAGETVTMTYTVQLDGAGDGRVRNTAWAPATATAGPTPDCAATTLPCATEAFDLPRLTISKVADRATLPADGGDLTYTVTVTNPGPGDYTAGHPATFTDDLSDVLDDASALTVVSSSAGAAATDGATLGWSGVLAAGQSALMVYRATYDDDKPGGDHVLVNRACVPVEEALDPRDACRATQTPGSGLRRAKSVDPASGTAVVPGQLLTYTLTFQNVGGADATVDITDDLAGVLDDAELVGTPDAGPGLVAVQTGDELRVTGTVAVGETSTVTYQVRVRDLADQGDHVLGNVLSCPPTDVMCSPRTTTNPVRHLTLTKTSDATADSAPGDEVTYTVTAVNDGGADFTAGDPATVVDDLAGVLDDAAFDGRATASTGAAPSYDAPRLTWSGALAAGDRVTITYTVRLTGGGDGVVRNVAWAPSTPGDTPDCADPAVTVPCAEVSYELPRLTVVKTASRSSLPATGEPLSYTVVVRNPGPGDYTADHQAELTDDLSDVLDDATLVAGSLSADAGTAELDGSRVRWHGTLVAGASARITYTVTYRGTGDRVLTNTACVPAAEAVTASDACSTVSVPGSGLQHAKSVDPASGTPVRAGQVLTYTLTFRNAGPADAAVDARDDLADVLDDAELVDVPDAGPGLGATVSGTVLAVTGTVPAGETRTVTYQVRVLPDADQGDGVLVNALGCEPGEPTPCAPETTRNPVRHLTLTKQRVGSGPVDTGDRVAYRLVLRNDGVGDFTEEDPARLVDDLTGVLDDATWDGAVEATTGTPHFSAPRLTWSGPLAAGQAVTLDYTVTVTNAGDHVLRNAATVRDCPEASCQPDPVVVPLPHVVPAKSASPPSGASLPAGDVVTYTLTWTNDGEATGSVASTDDLADVLDDADLVGEPTSSRPAVTATRTGTTLRVVGTLAPGETVTVTYTVAVHASRDQGDDTLTNVLVPDTPQVTCLPTGRCTPVPPPSTTHRIGGLVDWKSVDPASGATVQAGRRLTYTLHFAGTDDAPVAVDRVDDLSGVLDDATLVAAPVTSTPALTVSGPTDGRIAVTGRLDPGVTATVSYSVQVRPDGQRGDDRLGNFLLDPGQPVPSACEPADPARPDCTLTHVSAVEVAKTSVPATGTTLGRGDRVRYTLTYRNVGGDGASPAPVESLDHLTDVLDDARIVGRPVVRGAGLRAVLAGTRLTVAGSLRAGQVATVTYVVQVDRRGGGGGDGTLTNVVGEPGMAAPCVTGSTTCTVHPVADPADDEPGDEPRDEPRDEPGDEPGDPHGGQDPGVGDEDDRADGSLPATGSPVGPWVLVLGMLLVIGGVGVVGASRRGRTGPGSATPGVGIDRGRQDC